MYRETRAQPAGEPVGGRRGQANDAMWTLKQFPYDYMANPDGDMAVRWTSQGGAGFRRAEGGTALRGQTGMSASPSWRRPDKRTQTALAGVIRHFRTDPPLRNAPSPPPGPGTIQAEIPALRDTILRNPETLEDLCGTYGTGIEDNAGPIAVTIAILGGFAAIIQVSVVRPMHQGFDAVNQRIDDQIKYVNERFDDQNRSIAQRFDDQNKLINQRFDAVNQRFDAVDQRFDAQDRRTEDLVKDVSELRKLSDRVTRSETRIDALTEQLQTADAPSPPD